MSRTANQWIGDTPFSDAQQPIGPEYFKDLTGGSVVSLSANTLLLTTPASVTGTLVATVDLFQRTGYAPLYQEKFGTAASVPGPSGVANTGDPLQIVGFPPFTAANNPIKTPASMRGYIPKGAQVNSYTLCYKNPGNALTSITTGLYANTLIYAQAAPTSVAIVATAQNGLHTGISTVCYLDTVTNATPGFLVTPNTLVQLQITPVTAAGGTFVLYGVVFNVTYNFA